MFANPGCRVIRRSVVRYCLLSYILCVRRVSSRLRSRYPTTQDIIKSGLLRPDEAKKIGLEDSGEMYDSNWSLPLKWAIEICSSGMGSFTVFIDVVDDTHTYSQCLII